MFNKETAPINPGWIKSIISNEYNDIELQRIVLFYVIHTPCSNISYSSKTFKSYGWKKDVWQKGVLKRNLFNVAGLENGKTFYSVTKTEDIKGMFKTAKLSSKFYKNRDIERIAIYQPSGYNNFTGILYHIRNSLAHGRFTIYPAKKPDNPDEIYFVMEDGVKKGDKFYVRARLVLKRSTLLEWIYIIENKAQEYQEVKK